MNINEYKKRFSIFYKLFIIFLLKQENKALNIFYKREKTKIYLVTDKTFENKLPEHIEIINVNMNEGECDLVALSTILLNKNIIQIKEIFEF